jgi:hypothetical protein
LCAMCPMDHKINEIINKIISRFVGVMGMMKVNVITILKKSSKY